MADRSDKRTIVLGITGGIAAYKACELVRTFVRDGHRVKVIMTKAATRFVGPLTFRTLSGEGVATSLWEDAAVPVHHISLAEEADVFVIAPCTANVMAKLVCGRADDLLTTTALATKAPMVVAPAMNASMWLDPITQENIETLCSRGIRIVPPGTGELACGSEGVGRLADVADIVMAVNEELCRRSSLKGRRVLVTAGSTREPLDPVRSFGNRASGRTGFAVAKEAMRLGAEVVLVTGPTSLPDLAGVEVVRIETAAEMSVAAKDAFTRADAAIMTAAVADYRPKAYSPEKIKKGDASLTIELERTEDILLALAAEKGDRLVVGFAAETGDPIDAAKDKLTSKGVDLIVANDVSDPSLGFASERNRVAFVDAHGVEQLDETSKEEIARRLMDRVAEALGPESRLRGEDI